MERVTNSLSSDETSKKFDQGYFEGVGSAYVGGYALNDQLNIFFERRIADICRCCGNRTRLKLLEVGCAYGFFLQLCERRGLIAFGVDVSDYAIDRARAISHATLKVHDIETGPPFTNEKFDVVAAFDVLEHTRDPSKAIKNIWSSLHDEGIVELSTPNPNSFLFRRVLHRWKDPDETHISVKKPAQWVEMLQSSGFQVLRCKTESALVSNGHGLNRLLNACLMLRSRCLLGDTTEIIARKIPQ
jgi:2-polyprenyl-3-methyl-5-hydroxy-6-metoxy-1,4-benzoquinol methylase